MAVCMYGYFLIKFDKVLLLSKIVRIIDLNQKIVEVPQLILIVGQ